MAKILLNNISFPLNTFNRNTAFNTENGIHSYAFFTLFYNSVNPSDLYDLAENTITSIIIKDKNDDIIYSLENIEAHLNSIDETFTNETISVSVNIQFN